MKRYICEHDFKKIKRFLFPRGYSKCVKCGLLRHDEDGHTFRTFKQGWRVARSHGRKH